jgi:hypothetical protein
MLFLYAHCSKDEHLTISFFLSKHLTILCYFGLFVKLTSNFNRDTMWQLSATVTSTCAANVKDDIASKQPIHVEFI